MAQSNVFNCDCVEYMKTLPDNFFDLCIADPPYGDGTKNKIGGYLQGKTEGSGRGSRDTSVQLETILRRDVGRTIPKTNHAYGGRFARYSNMGWGVEIPKWDVAPGEEYFKEMFRVSRNQITL